MSLELIMLNLVRHLRFSRLHSSSLLWCCLGWDLIGVIESNIQKTALFLAYIAIFCYLGH